ncbi:MAG: GDP-mannose 4,6-dehydratase [Promethearchaeota archaeon]|nr:MAG: GDP-mannose 4,6-dehydratase [Candidatus Lokiarchaeota archaeon]
MSKKVLISGGAGFFGSHLTDFCIIKGKKVFSIDLPNSSLKNLIQYTDGKIHFPLEKKLKAFNIPIQIPTTNKNFVFLECDLNNADLIEKIIKKIKPDYIFHFAAQPSVIPSWEDPVATIETNVIGTINIFEPIKKYKIQTRVIVACSSAEYGTTTSLNRPLKETDPLLPIHPYGISKVATELLSRQYFINFGIEVINLRFFNQTGPRRKGDATADFISKVAKIELGLIEPLIEVGNLNHYRDFTGIKDSLKAIWLAATKGTPGETYNICSGRKIQIRQILNIALKFSSKKIKVIENVPDKLRKTDEDIILGDNSKIKNDLDWDVTIPIEETLKDMYDYWIDYYKKYGI